MKPWQRLDSAPVPGSREQIQLYQRGDEYAIKIGAIQLMNSRMHGSEEALAELGCQGIATTERASVLVGGLGMGYTLAATLKQLNDTATVEVAELMPPVVEWNRNSIGHLADHPLKDPRVTLYEGDIIERLKVVGKRYDAILLDVDNGPDALTRDDNDWLYSENGLRTIKGGLKPGGCMAVWSEGSNPAFTKRLRRVGFKVVEHHPRFHGKGRGGRHTIWLARC